ncbi:YfjI family protein [Crossiella sp. S99.2]|uniref:YfjI family protein n=1 Tax=Crossiella sp. S99.2 TaxID=2936272 RepID=UPI001FFFEB42|nr:YfjI family protein [Crossiella sp. S99.2]MCK2238065.1 YfjI family protein [Crossiella sp. S99.2]
MSIDTHHTTHDHPPLPVPEPSSTEELDTVDAWEAPASLGTDRKLPAFPVEVLPAWMADQIRAVAEFTQTPRDLAGSIALSALATAAARRAVVVIRPGWPEPTNLFLLVALPPGNRKSPVFDAMIAPIIAAEEQLKLLAEPRIEMAKVESRIAERDAEKAANLAALDDEHSVQTATEAALRARSITIPAQPRLIGDDGTPEAVAGVLAEQGGRLAILSDEGTIVANLAGRYSGGSPNFEVFLKGHSGGTMRVDRRGRAYEHVTNVALTLGLAVQPHVLRDLAAIPGGGVDEKGLLARFLFSLPHSTVGYRATDVPPVSAQVANAYHRQLTELTLRLNDRAEHPAELAFSPEANAAMRALQAEIEPRLRPRADWAHITGWGNKYAGSVARLAGLLHLARHTDIPDRTPITADTFAGARQLGEYFAAHALAAFEHMATTPTDDTALAVLRWIERTPQISFTRRDAFAATRSSRIRRVTDIDPALTMLEDLGHIRRAPEPDRAGARGRKPSPVYFTHPQHRPEPGGTA